MNHHQTLLLLDANYLARRAMFSTGELEFDGQKTGTLFGFFRDLVFLQDDFPNCRFAFCFDRGGSVRENIYPDYKKSRRLSKRSKTVRELGDEKHFFRQVKALRETYLPEIGYRNVFSQPGYEADDLIASLIGSYRGPIVIVSADTDLYQLLSDQVRIWNPRKQFLLTRKTFEKLYGIRPHEWVKVKAIAGCSSDDIKGVQGVGEKTALKYLRGELDEESKTYQSIEDQRSLIKDNKVLVRLPFPGTNVYELQNDDLSPKKWNDVMKQIGLRSLRTNNFTGV